MFRSLFVNSLLILVTYIFRTSIYHLPNPFDMYLFLPLVRQWAGVDFNSVQGDLLFTGGAQAPFILYRLFAWLIYIGADESLVLGFTYFLSHILTFLGSYLIFSKFIRNGWHVSFLTTLYLIIPGSFFVINWNIFPPQAPVSSSIGAPLVLIAMAMALKKNDVKSGIFSGISALFHPAFGLLSALVSLALSFYCNGRLFSLFYLVKRAAVLTLPAGIIASLLTLSNQNLGEFNKADFFDGIRQYADHLYPEIHLTEGYGIFFLLIISALFLSKVIPLLNRAVLITTLISTSLFFVSLFNLELELSSGITLLYLSRAFVLVRPFIFLSLILGIIHLLKVNRDLVRQLIILILSSLWICIVAINGEYPVPDMDLRFAPLITLTLLSIIIVFPRNGVSQLLLILLTALSLLAQFGSTRDASLMVLVIAIALGVIFLIVDSDLFQEDQLPVFKLKHLALPVLIVILVAVSNKPKIAWPSMRVPCVLSDVPYQWILTNTPPNSLFVINPEEFALGAEFRLCSSRGLFISRPDINQVAYSPTFYKEARYRMELLGLEFNGLRNHTCMQNLKFNSFIERISAPSFEIIEREVTHALLRSSAEAERSLGGQIIFNDGRWIVSRLSQ